MAPSVRTQRLGNVAVVYMNRPEVLNAFNREMLRRLLDAFAEIGDDSEARAVVLTGENGSFTTGEDLSEGIQMSAADFRELIDLVQAVTTQMRALSQPVIAAIDGYAFGGGLEIAAACDMRVASEGTKFCCPEVNIGQVITNGASVLLPRIMGDGRARELVFTGDVFDVDWCYEAGLVNRVVASAKLTEEAVSLAERIASRAPQAVRMSKELFNSSAADDVNAAIGRETDSVMAAFETQDSKEGFKAFFEKREPQFVGS